MTDITIEMIVKLSGVNKQREKGILEKHRPEQRLNMRSKFFLMVVSIVCKKKERQGDTRGKLRRCAIKKVNDICKTFAADVVRASLISLVP